MSLIHSIKWRLAGAIGLIVITLAVVSGLAIMSIERSNRANRELSDRVLPDIQLANLLEVLAQSVAVAAPELAAAESPYELQKVDRRIKGLIKLIRQQGEPLLKGQDAQTIKLFFFHIKEVESLLAEAKTGRDEFFRLQTLQGVRLSEALEQATKTRGIMQYATREASRRISDISGSLYGAELHKRAARFKKRVERELENVASGLQMLSLVSKVSLLLHQAVETEDFHALREKSDEFERLLWGIQNQVDLISTDLPKEEILTQLEKLEQTAVGEEGLFKLTGRIIQQKASISHLLLQTQTLNIKLGQLTEKHAQTISDGARARMEELSRSQGTDLIIMLVLLGVSLVVAVLVSWLMVGRSIAGRLERLRQAMVGGQKGHQDLRIDTSGRGEIAEMSKALVYYLDTIRKENEERQKAEELFRNMAANVPGTLYQQRVTAEGSWEFTYISDKCLELYGHPAAEVIKERIRLNWHPRDLERINQGLKQAMSNGQEINLMGRIFDPEGQLRWVRFNASPSTDEAGELIYNGFILDVTQRKLAEQEYLVNERKIKAMSQAVEDALIMIDDQGRVLFWNPAAEKLFGYSEAEALGMDFHAMAAPEQYQEKAKNGLAHFARSGQGPVLGVTTEIEARNRQGRTFPVEVTLSSFQMDEQWYAVGTVRDISQRKENEKILRSYSERLTLATEAGGIGVWEWNVGTNQIDWDEQSHEIYGVESGRLNSMKFWRQLVHPDDLQSTEQALEDALAGRSDYDIEYRIIRPNGEIRHLKVAAEVVCGEKGDPQRMIGVTWDITERKEAEEAVRQSELKVRSVLNNISTGIVIIDPEDHTIFDVNPSALEMIGAPREEIVGHTCHNFICPREVTDCPVTDHNQEIENAERVLLTSAGEEVPILKTVVPLELGGKTYLLESLVDITERTEAEELVRESQERLDLAMRASNTGLWDWRPLEQNVYRNDQWFRQLGYEPGELANDTSLLMKLMHPDDAAEKSNAMDDYSSRGHDDFRQEFRLRAKDGSWKWITSVGRVVERDESGRISRIVGVHLDMTERKKAEEKVRESQERLDMAMKASNTGTWDWRPLDNQDFHNDQWFRQLGYERSDFPDEGAALFQLIHPEDAEQFKGAMDDFAADSDVGDDFGREFRMKAKDGSWKWIQSVGQVIDRDEQGRVARVVGVHLDITAQKQAQEALLDSSRRLEQIIDFLPDPTWVIDGRGVVTAWNLAVEELTGVKAAEMTGKGNYEYSLPFYGERRPLLLDLVSRWDEELAKTYLNVSQVGEGVLVSESFHPDLRGGTYLAGTARVLQDLEGNYVGAIESVRDITERKLAETELKERMDELERFSRLVVGREERMILLKEEINGLLAESGKQAKYKIVV